MPAQVRYGQGGAADARNGLPCASGGPASCAVTYDDG